MTTVIQINNKATVEALFDDEAIVKIRDLAIEKFTNALAEREVEAFINSRLRTWNVSSYVDNLLKERINSALRIEGVNLKTLVQNTVHEIVSAEFKKLISK